MGEIIIVEKTKADTLLSLGFKYIVRNIEGNTCYVFVQTPDLMKELGSNFDQSSFLINKNICF